MNRISEDIQKGSFARFYLLYGEEDYLRRYNVNRLKEAILPQDDQLNLTVWKEDSFDLGEFTSQAVTMPFFAEHRLLIVEDCGLFKKGGGDLAEFLPSVPEETIIVFSESEVDKRSSLFKLVKTAGALMECKRLKDAALSDWVLRGFGREGKQVQRSALQLFLERCGSDMQQISQEIRKLVDYTYGRDGILLEDVRAVTTEYTETKVFAMVDEISRRDTMKALERYHELLAAKESPVKIIVIMGREFEKLCRIRELRERGMDQNSIAERMGMQGFAVRKALGQASRFSMDELKSALRLCVQTDEDIKTGRVKDALAVETAIVQITAFSHQISE